MAFGHYRACPRFGGPLNRRSYGPHGYTPEPPLVENLPPNTPR